MWRRSIGAEELRVQSGEAMNETALLDLAYELCPERAAEHTEAQWRSNLWAGTVAVLLGPEPFEADDEHARGGAKFLETLKGQLMHQLMRESPTTLL